MQSLNISLSRTKDWYDRETKETHLEISIDDYWPMIEGELYDWEWTYNSTGTHPSVREGKMKELCIYTDEWFVSN